MNCCFFGELRQETQSGGTSKVCEEYNLVIGEDPMVSTCGQQFKVSTF
jgi:hypothetical protein